MDYYLEISSRCIECDNCRLICPEKAIFMDNGNYTIEPWACTLCNACTLVCPVDCIKEVSQKE